VSSRFDYIKYDEDHTRLQSIVKTSCQSLEECIDALPKGRAPSLALTKLEECYMWMGKAIRDHQIASGGDASDQPSRTDI